MKEMPTSDKIVKPGDLVAMDDEEGGAGSYYLYKDYDYVSGLSNPPRSGEIVEKNLCLVICKKGDCLCVLSGNGVLGWKVERWFKLVWRAQDEKNYKTG